MPSSFFALFDDIASILDDIASVADDVATMTKVAAKKTAGVLGDDLALNAQQVTGVNADRELPVVWAVAKGSLVNKAILIPAALAISAFLPALVLPLLMIGGFYLCYEGVEKLVHRGHAKHEAKASEADKIKGAIRTDFILSAEIIVIALGTVANQPLGQRVAVLTGIGLLMTVGVYGLVAGIVKLDDAGLRLVQKPATRWLGRGLLRLAPVLMKTLSVVGTAAMFLVGGSIVAHGLPGVEHALHEAVHSLPPAVATLATTVAEGVLGVLAGLATLGVVLLVQRAFRR